MAQATPCGGDNAQHHHKNREDERECNQGTDHSQKHQPAVRKPVKSAKELRLRPQNTGQRSGLEITTPDERQDEESAMVWTMPISTTRNSSQTNSKSEFSKGPLPPEHSPYPRHDGGNHRNRAALNKRTEEWMREHPAQSRSSPFPAAAALTDRTTITARIATSATPSQTACIGMPIRMSRSAATLRIAEGFVRKVLNSRSRLSFHPLGSRIGNSQTPTDEPKKKSEYQDAKYRANGANWPQKRLKQPLQQGRGRDRKQGPEQRHPRAPGLTVPPQGLGRQDG
jgi:hypothetical protein